MHLSMYRQSGRVHLPLLYMALKPEDVGRPDLDGMEVSAVLFSLAQKRIFLVSDYSTTCKSALAWIALVIDAVPSNCIHAEYRTEGDVLKRLRDVVSCSLEEFLVTILDHVDKRHKLLEQVIG